MKTAFLFPGQGTQKVGMGRDIHQAFPAAKRVFDRAEQASGLSLRKLCFEGPQQQLSRTDICQPAVFTVSAAMLAALGELRGAAWAEAIRPEYMAGLSLGEYTALYAADAIDLEPAVRLVARRGRLMQEAALAVPSGMITVIGLDEQRAQELCAAAADGQILTCANFNCPEQVVLSGEAEACDRVEAKAAEFGAAGTVRLEVAGAFHSEIMQPAAEGLAETLADIELRRPSSAIISNIDAAPYDGPDDIRHRLLAQLTSPVRWQSCVSYMLGRGAERFYEIGPGRVLAGLMRRIDRNAEITCVNSPKAVEKLSGLAGREA